MQDNLDLHIELVDHLQETQKKQRTQQFKETGTSRHIYQNKLDKGCFQYDVANKDFEDLTGITASLKYCVIKHLILPKMQNMTDIKEVLL